MASRGRPYKGPIITQAPSQGEIELSDRQKQLLEARRRAKETSLQSSRPKGGNYNGGAKRDPTPRMNHNPHSWSDEQTVPTTWSDSSSSANSAVSNSQSAASASMSKASASSRANPAKQFYGQGLTGQAKNLYDDSGESYHGSRSEAASAVNKQPQEPAMMPRRVNRPSRKKAKAKGTDPASLASDDKQKAFLRKMMKSYTSKPSKSKEEASSLESSSVDEPSRKKSWLERKPKLKALSSASSGSSSASHDKAIMRKVLERARNKKLALANPRKQKLIKQSSSRMKKLMSPKRETSSPRTKSIGSPHSASSEASGSTQSSKRFGFGNMLVSKKKKSSRSPRFSSRNAKSRLYNKPESIIEDISPRKSLDNHLRETETHSNDSSAPKMFYDDASFVLDETQEPSGLANADSADMSVHSKPDNIDIRRQATEVSALTGRHSHDSAESGNLVQSRSAIDSIPEVTNDDEIEIKLSHSSSSHRSNGAESKQSAVFPSQQGETMYDDTAYDAPEIFNPEPEGYRDFLHTLKAEVAGSHTQLWKSFHSVFKGTKKARPLKQGNGSKAFDDKTKRAVASMSTYLKKEYEAESEAGTQLANDKAVKSTTSFGQHVLNRTGAARYGGGLCVAPQVDEEPTTSNFDDALSKNVRANLGEKANHALMMTDTESEISSYVASSVATSYVESDYISEAGSIASSSYSRGRPKVSTVSRALAAVPRSDQSNKGSSISPKSMASKLLNKSKPAIITTSMQEAPSDVARNHAMSDVAQGKQSALAQGEDPTTSTVLTAKAAPRSNFDKKELSPNTYDKEDPIPEIKSMPSWKAQAIANAKSKKVDPSTDNKPDGPAPWVGVKLRSVTATPSGNKPKKNSMAISLTESKGAHTPASSTTSSIPSSWAKVKLRRVVAKEKAEEPKKSGEEPKTTEVQSNDNIHHFVVRKPKTPPAKPLEETKTSEIAPTKEPPSPVKKSESPSTSSATSDCAVEKSSSDVSNTDAIISTGAADSSTDGTVSVPLAPGPESKSFFGLKVIVGKKGIMKIDCPPNQSQANVIWRLEVNDLKSAMLDMSGYKVKLLQTNGEHKDLAFETSEYCMRFANAFHEVANGGDDGSDDEDSVAESDGSVFVEQLSEEEQKVLEEFRKKKRLSSDPSEAMSVDEPSDGNSKGPVAEAALTKPPMGGMSFLDQIKSRSAQEPDTSDQQTANSSQEPTSNLSAEDQKVVDSYKKMLKLRIPMEAVKHKMEKDNVDPKLMNIVLGGDDSVSSNPSSNQASANGLTVAEQAVAATYQRMLKMMVPPEGVRHKMEKDGVDVKIIFAVLDGGEGGKSAPASALAASKPAHQLSEKDEATAAPYRKMLKFMMPKEAVEHKLKKDGVAPHIMASVLGVDVSTLRGGKHGPTKLTDEEESIASSFRKMLNLKISKDAIRRKMQTEGISENIMIAVLGESFMKGSNRGQKTPPKRMKGGFHWSPLTSGDSLRKSVWNKASLTEYAESDVASDISKHLEMFQKKEDDKVATQRIAKKDGTETKVMAKLIDLSRANNVAITLKAFNDVSQQELAKIIEFVDPHGKIKGDRALFMRDLLPAAAEIKVVQNYKGEDNRLVPAEIWFKQIAHIKRVEEKIQVMRTMETFRLEVLALAESFQMLIDVCNQIMNSEKLPDILEMVRQIGNRMNEGRGEEAAGFKLDFLSRLSQTKGSDKKTTALDLVVMILLARNQRSALRLSSDFPKCQEASKLQISELHADVRRLGGALQKCKKEKELMRKDGSIPKWGKLPSDDTKRKPSNSEWFANRSNFLSSVLDRGESPKVPSPTTTEPAANSPLEDTQEQSKVGCTDDDGYNMNSAVSKIDKFLTEATNGFDQLKQVNEEAISTCKELSEFFCEKGGEKATSNLLAVLASFAGNLDLAVKKQEEQEKRRDARLKNAQQKKVQTAKISSKHGHQPARSPTNSVISNISTTSNVSGTSDDSFGGKSLVFMVNQMLKMAGDKAKEDFAKGVTYNNPDSRLKQIYDKESRRDDIVGKIQSRRQTSEHAAQTGLSELVKRIESRSARVKSAKMETATALVRKIRHSAESSDSSRRTSRGSIGSTASYESRDDEGSAGVRKTSVADRWTRKIDEDQVSDSGGSATLSSFSANSADMRVQSRRRQQVISRWASTDGIVEASSKDLDEESDIGFTSTAVSNTRQRYLDRWATKNE